MSFEILESHYGIREGARGVLFDEALPEAPVSAVLTEPLRRARHVVMVNDRARAYRRVAPVLSELEELRRGKSYLVNGNRPDTIYGCVTTGHDWQFVRLDAPRKKAHVDTRIFQTAEPGKLLGVLCHIVDTTLAQLPELASER